MVHVRPSHTLAAAVLSAALLLAPAAGASAAPSCAGLVTTFETQIAPGFVGAEVRGLAGADGFSDHVTALARAHATSVEGCFGS